MKLFNKFLYMVLGGLLIIGCDAESFDQDVDPIGSTDSYPTPTFELQGSPEMISNENDLAVYTWTVTLDKPISFDTKFGLELDEGSTASSDDFVVTNATIPAFETTGTITLTVSTDQVAEDTEIAKLKAVSGPGNDDLVQYLTHPDAVYPSYELTIENHLIDINQITFDWEEANPNALQYDGGYYGPCANGVDIDVYITTTPEFSWDDEIGNYGAATSACPEVFEISSLEDGTYYFWSDYYSNPYYSYFDGTYDGIINPTPKMPITSKLKTFSTAWPVIEAQEATFVQSDADAFSGMLGGYVENFTYDNKLLFKLVIENGVWTASAN